MVCMMSARVRARGYQDITIKIVAMVAIFSVVMAFAVVTVYRLNDTITHDEKEFLWFKAVSDVANDTTATIYVYSADDVFIEQLLLLNNTDWQKSTEQYTLRTYVRIFVEFWYMETKLNNILYMIGRSPVVITDLSIIFSIVSDWEVPLF